MATEFVIEEGVLRTYLGNGGAVLIPKDVTSIGEYAFLKVDSITSVLIPEGVTEIGAAAFRDCCNLKNVAIPDSVTKIGSYAFEGCPEVEFLISDSAANRPDNFEIKDGQLTGYTGLGGNVIIPDGVKAIGFHVFADCSTLESVIIPDGVTDIDSWAFNGCSNLRSVIIPNSVQKIGANAFGDCSALNSIIIPENVTSIDDRAFQDCVNLRSISIPDSVTSMGKDVFDGCLNTEFIISDDASNRPESFVVEDEKLIKYSGIGGNIVIPDGVTCIGEKAFQGCSILKSVKLPESVTSLDKGAFLGCTVKSIILSDALKSIGSKALGCHCDRVFIPQNVTCIEDDGFIDNSGYSRGGVNIKEIVVDENNPAFLSIDGVLFKKNEDGTTTLFAVPSEKTAKYTIPKGVICISGYALTGSNLKGLVIPRGLTNLPRKYEMPDYMAIEFMTGYVQTKEKISADYIDYISIEDATDCAYVALYQNGKKWSEKTTLFLGQSNENTNNTIREIIRVLTDEKDEKAFSKAAESLLTVIDTVDHELVKDFYKTCYEKHSKKALKLLIDNNKVQAILLEETSGVNAEKGDSCSHPAEEKVKELWKLSNTTKKLGDIISAGIRYKDSEDVCSDQVLKYVIATYAEQLNGSERFVSEYKFRYVSTKFNQTTDEIAEALNREDLQEILEQLAFNEKYWKDGYLIPFARFASSRQITKLVANMRKWESDGSRGRAAIIIARGGLMLSDTREAMMAVDKTGGLPYYASLRHKDPDVLRDTMLSDFGFNEKGDKIYDLGGNELLVRVNDELQLTLYDSNAGKSVKSIPKKNADPVLYNFAKTDFADLKKNIRKVYTNRKKILFNAFLNGKEFIPEYWMEFYQGNPVLAAITRLLVWQQGNMFFTISQGKTIDYSENEYSIDNKTPIRIAYPTEMESEEIAGWQRYFIRNSLKQPFAQIWEPVYSVEDIKEDRYSGCTLPILRFNNKEEHGIWMDGLYSYSESFQVQLKDCSLECEPSVGRFVFGVTDDAKYVLKNFKINLFSRYANHIVSMLDKWTIEDRIKKDDTSIIHVLQGSTIVQIKHYIEVAGENNSVGCQAVLLEYMNQTFESYDPLAEYLLEED